MSKKEITFDLAEGILSLIGKELTAATYDSWSKEQREKAVEYAGACHLRASDNNNRVPSRPPYVHALPDLDWRRESRAADLGVPADQLFGKGNTV